MCILNIHITGISFCIFHSKDAELTNNGWCTEHAVPLTKIECSGVQDLKRDRTFEAHPAGVPVDTVLRKVHNTFVSTPRYHYTNNPNLVIHDGIYLIVEQPKQ